MTQDSSQYSSQTSSQRSIPVVKFLIPLALQSLIILAIPAQAIYTHLSGQTVFLKTAPVDPYDPMRGYSVTLGYEVSRLEVLKTLPGWKEVIKGEVNPRSVPLGGTAQRATPSPKDGTVLYVTIEPATGKAANNSAWQPTAVSLKKPDPAPHQAVLKGQMKAGRLDCGLDTYYMPERRRSEVNDAIRLKPSLMEAKVDKTGNATPVRLWVGDRAYEF
jgi:uncharacterized membrane-anchored protein